MTESGLAKREESRLYRGEDERENPRSETTEWLVSFREACADCLSQAGLNQSSGIHQIFAIFVLKSQHDWRDNSTVTIRTENDASALPSLNQEEIEAICDSALEEYRPIDFPFLN